jgi:hypothetical protein
MPIMPSKTAENTWNIYFSVKVDGEVRFVNEEFVGTIREALFYEMQLRGLAKDGCLDLNAS